MTASDPRSLREGDQDEPKVRVVVPAPADKDRPPKDKAEKKGRTAEEKLAAKEARRDAKLRRDAHRPLEAWERYRALVDALDEAQELVDLADHKARFALIIMTALNAVLFVLGTRTEVVGAIPEGLRGWVGAYLLIYAFLALYFFLQAIESLRPRKSRPQVAYPGETGYQDYPMGLRFYEDILRRDVEAYRRAWREVHIGQLTSELAVQAHALARINHAKYGALQRLYVGLQVMTLMAGMLLALDAYYLIVAHRREVATTATNAAAAAEGPKIKSGKPSRGGLRLLGKPERIAAGTREPSGVAYHPPLGHVFVVGDEGRLVELDAEGAPLRSDPVKGNLEDVAVHTPSGKLVLLSEKKSELVWYDPVAHREEKRWRLDAAQVLGEEPADKNQGFEGLAFRELPGRPGGGLFYLVHQRAPAMVVALAVDADRPAGRLDGGIVTARFPFRDHEDLTAAAWSAALDRLLIITDTKDRLLVVGTDGNVEVEVVLPGLQQEGLCLDDAGSLWVADDRAGLMRFKGALDALEGALKAGSSPAAPADEGGGR